MRELPSSSIYLLWGFPSLRLRRFLLAAQIQLQRVATLLFFSMSGFLMINIIHVVSTSPANNHFVTSAAKSIELSCQLIEHASLAAFLEYRSPADACEVLVTNLDKSRFKKHRSLRYTPVIQFTTVHNTQSKPHIPNINTWNAAPVFVGDIVRHLPEAFASARLYQKLRASAARLSTLNERERRVVLLASEGVPNKSIARRLDVSVKTVEKSRRNAYSKLLVNSSAEVASLVTFGRFFVDFQNPEIGMNSHLPAATGPMISNSMMVE